MWLYEKFIELWQYDPVSESKLYNKYYSDSERFDIFVEVWIRIFEKYNKNEIDIALKKFKLISEFPPSYFEVISALKGKYDDYTKERYQKEYAEGLAKFKKSWGIVDLIH
jgi:hypothetical protein